MKIILTGGSGFVGTSLRECWVRDGHDIVNIDRIAPRERFADEFETHERCDLLDRSRLTEVMRWHKPDAVVHVAAQARVEPSVTDPLATYDLNAHATLNVLHAVRDTRVPHLAVASSEAIYGQARKFPSEENNDFNPANPYAASKVAVDVMCQQFDRIVPTAVVRSGMGWGPRSNPAEQVVARFIVRALQDKPLRFPADAAIKHPTRDLNHVQDFAEGVTSVLEKRARGVFNLSGGKEFSLVEIAERVVKATGSGRIEFDPTFQYREGEIGARTWLDVSKAKRELGHEPRRHFDDEKVLRNVVDWYRDNKPDYWS